MAGAVACAVHAEPVCYFQANWARSVDHRKFVPPCWNDKDCATEYFTVDAKLLIACVYQRYAF